MLLAIAAAAPLLTGTALGAVLDASTPAPIAVLLATPTGEAGRVSRSEAIRALEGSLRSHTDLEPKRIDPIVNEDCRGRLACLVQRLARGRGETRTRWLLVVTQLTLEGEPDRVSLTLVDVEQGLNRIRGAAPADAEVRVSEVSRRSEAARVEDAGALQEVLDRVFREDFSEAWERSGDLAAQGRIVLSGVPAAAIVHLDDRFLGAGDGEALVIERVSAGLRRVRVTAAGAPPFETAVRVMNAGEAEVVVRLPSPAPAGRGARVGIAIAGGALAAAGVGLAMAAALTARTDVRAACFADSAGCRGGVSFIGFDYDPEAEGAADIDDGALGLAPIGAALAVTGLGFTLGALLEDGEGAPWWSMLGSAVAGAAVLGAAAALDQGRVR